MIKNHEEKENPEESKDSLESTQKEEEKPGSPIPPPGRKSPEPSCAICLEHLTNKSFTDECFHMFCFTCLLEWSKVKPECPLCKKTFSSIVYNVRSFKEYDQYFVQKSKTTDDSRLWGRRFHFRTTLTPERLHSNNRPEFESYLSHRMRFAPHSVHDYRISFGSSAFMPTRRVPNSFRQRIYDDNLWALPQNTSRIRCISPEFFRQNIACTHRLLPWLNRELIVVMPFNESQISFVIELIMALLVKYDIRSQEFHSLIEPYTGIHTAHFVHEFYSFAISPYESLETYDINIQYDETSVQTYETVSSPDSDVIPLPMDYSNPVQGSTSNGVSRRKKQTQLRKKHTKGSKKLKKLILKKNEKNVWESVTPEFVHPSYITKSVPFEFAGPSTSRGIPFLNSLSETQNVDIDVLNDVECLESDDGIEVINVLKPIGERTPEMVNLSSDESSNFISELTIDDKNKSTETSKTENNDLPSNEQIHIVSDDECKVLYIKETKFSEDANTANEVVLDKPIDYSVKTLTNKLDLTSFIPVVEPCSSNNAVKLEKDTSSHHKSSEDCKLEAVKPERSTVIQSLVCTVANEDNASSSLSPLLRPKKRRSVIIDDGSTESCSDGAQVSEINSGRKKLKLKSVVAHYSYEHSDENESIHHSAVHKKQRIRKKKKKKHKHRRRIYSSDSD